MAGNVFEDVAAGAVPVVFHLVACLQQRIDDQVGLPAHRGSLRQFPRFIAGRTNKLGLVEAVQRSQACRTVSDHIMDPSQQEFDLENLHKFLPVTVLCNSSWSNNGALRCLYAVDRIIGFVGLANGNSVAAMCCTLIEIQ